MAQGYKLVEKKNLGRDAAEQPTKVYAIPKYNGYTDMDTLCKMIGARSTVSSADVKAVLDNLNFVLDMELQAGRIVQLGEFGNFRLSLSSEGANDMEGFDRSMIVGARMIFTAWRRPTSRRSPTRRQRPEPTMRRMAERPVVSKQGSVAHG